jgi:hypothetical protein
MALAIAVMAMAVFGQMVIYFGLNTEKIPIHWKIIMLKYEVRHQQFYSKNQVIRYYRHGEYHRLDGASSIWADGVRFWFEYGHDHRKFQYTGK